LTRTARSTIRRNDAMLEQVSGAPGLERSGLDLGAVAGG